MNEGRGEAPERQNKGAETESLGAQAVGTIAGSTAAEKVAVRHILDCHSPDSLHIESMEGHLDNLVVRNVVVHLEEVGHWTRRSVHNCSQRIGLIENNSDYTAAERVDSCRKIAAADRAAKMGVLEEEEEAS